METKPTEINSLKDKNKIRQLDRLMYGNVIITEEHELENYDGMITCSNQIENCG